MTEKKPLRDVEKRPRRRYSKPKLRVHGSLRDLTLSGTKGGQDSGPGSHDRS